MKTKFLVLAFLVASCLTSWAFAPSTITQENVDQIRLGQTTEADLVRLFGTPSTRFVHLDHDISIDWFRSVPASPASYIPIIGPPIWGLNVEAQQLTVVLGPSGVVRRYEVHSSLGHLHVAGRTTTTTTTVERTGYAK
ncbi:hypothetical protein BH20VER3_BH20VER3_17290 [soil metagenome]